MASKRDKRSDVPAADVDWLTKLAAEINIPFAPPGWFTMTQICDRTGRDHQAIRRLFKKMNVETKQFRYTHTNGKVSIVTHYFCTL